MILPSRTSSDIALSRGSLKAGWSSESGKHLNTNTCSIDAAQAHLCACQSSGSVKWKLETHKHFFNRRCTGATKRCAHVHSLPHPPGLRLATQKFTSGDFLLRNLQSNSDSLLNWTRIPDQRRSWPLFDFLK